jgi:hypothetical protein
MKGQTNVSNGTSGAEYTQQVREIVNGRKCACQVDLCECPAGTFEKIAFAGTDGCASMRSTPEYAGVDGHGEDGESYLAHQKKGVSTTCFSIKTWLFRLCLGVQFRHFSPERLIARSDQSQLDTMGFHCATHINNLGLDDVMHDPNLDLQVSIISHQPCYHGAWF